MRPSGGIITGSPVEPSTSVAKGVWTLEEARYWKAKGQWPAGGAPVTITQTANASEGDDLTTYTFPAQAFGAAAADRIVIVGIQGRRNAARTISSVTIGGVAATAIVTADATEGGAACNMAAIYAAAVPTGTTGDVVVVWSGAMFRCSIVVWRMVGGSITPHDTDTDLVLSGAALSLAIDCPANGAVVGFCYHGTADSTAVTWVGIAEEVDASAEDSAPELYSGAHTDFAAVQTGLTVSCTANVTSGIGALAVASFAPA